MIVQRIRTAVAFVCFASASLANTQEECTKAKVTFLSGLEEMDFQTHFGKTPSEAVESKSDRWKLAILFYNESVQFILSNRHLSKSILPDFFASDTLVDCWVPELVNPTVEDTELLAAFNALYSIERREELRRKAKELL